jgi:hypothetical protein
VGIWWLFSILFGIVVASIASNKGRNAVGWFFLGFFFGLIALIAVCIVSNLKEERARHERARLERRRLMEELRMERLRNRDAHGRTEARLSIHDRAVGIDTTMVDPARALENRTPVNSGHAAESSLPAAEWYYAVDQTDRIGPLAFHELAERYRAGQFGIEDLIWKSGWAQWRRLGEVDGLVDALAS